MANLEIIKHYQFWGDIWIRANWRVQEHCVTGQCRVLDSFGRQQLKGVREACLAEAERQAPISSNNRQAVVFVHSLAGTPQILSKLTKQTQNNGFTVANIAYPSLSASIEVHARRMENIVKGLAEDGVEQVSYVGHSMGGLVIRHLLAGRMPVRTGRIVFLGTPNKGALLAQRLQNFSAYKAFFGSCGFSVLPGVIASLPAPDAPMLVIAGGNGRRGYNPILPGDNDGIVRVEETGFENASFEFLRVHSLHRWLPLHRAANNAVLSFLNEGRNK